MKYFSIGVGITVLLVIVFFYIQKTDNTHPKTPPNQPVTTSLRVVSTNPDPLEGATILPTQFIEITFSKPVVLSEFKHRFDPPVEESIEVVGKGTEEFSSGPTFKISFKKPLQLGSGYTLFILGNTHSDKENLDHEYIYHFKTIKYNGI